MFSGVPAWAWLLDTDSFPQLAAYFAAELFGGVARNYTFEFGDVTIVAKLMIFETAPQRLEWEELV